MALPFDFDDFCEHLESIVKNPDQLDTEQLRKMLNILRGGNPPPRTFDVLLIGGPALGRFLGDTGFGGMMGEPHPTETGKAAAPEADGSDSTSKVTSDPDQPAPGAI